MKVTLNVFSGRENPTWELPQKDAKSFLERFAKKTVLSAADYQSQLGYNGFHIEATSDERLPDGIQPVFHLDSRLANEAIAFGHSNPLLSVAETVDAAQWLLSKAGKAVPDDIAAYVQGEVKTRDKVAAGAATLPKEASEDIALKSIVQPAACIIANTPYNPGFWNVPAVQPYNNCYNYAMNYKSNTFAQPGKKCGHMYTAFDCTNVGNAASCDGCTPACTGSSKLVALVIWPGHDFHWYRRNSEGFWSHKPGSTAVRNVDNSGVVINGNNITPANCNRGPYSNFCGYRYSPTGMVVS